MPPYTYPPFRCERAEHHPNSDACAERLGELAHPRSSDPLGEQFTCQRHGAGMLPAEAGEARPEQQSARGLTRACCQITALSHGVLSRSFLSQNKSTAQLYLSI